VRPDISSANPSLSGVRAKEADLSRPEAIRRLVELGLTVKHKRRQRTVAGAARAKELAAKVIDKKCQMTARVPTIRLRESPALLLSWFESRPGLPFNRPGVCARKWSERRRAAALGLRWGGCRDAGRPMRSQKPGALFLFRSQLAASFNRHRVGLPSPPTAPRPVSAAPRGPPLAGLQTASVTPARPYPLSALPQSPALSTAL
jgi:hypothetical protein